MKVVYVGKESSGKSLQLARKVVKLVKRNAKWFKITGIPRPIRSNMAISDHVVKWAKSLNVPIIMWEQLDEIIYETECDVIMDEVLKFFDARGWEKLTMDAKHWLTQGAKTGVHLYASAQDFSMVEKTFRLLCQKVYVVHKMIGSPRPMKTAPPVKRIWGVCIMREVKPESFQGDTASMEKIGWIPRFFMIERNDCAVFNTNAIVVPSNLPVLRLRYQPIEYIKDGEIEKKGERYA